MIEVKYFIVEPLKRSFRERNQSNRKVKTRKPGSGLDEMLQVFEVAFDIIAFADASHGGDESDSSVGLNHRLLLCCVKDCTTRREAPW
jgi:hypothetical protein